MRGFVCLSENKDHHMYDFNETISKLEDLDWHEMSQVVQCEIHTAERNAYSGKPGCVKHREMGALAYASRLKALAFFLGNCVIPESANEADIAIYRRITNKWVSKEQLKPEALNVFSGEDHSTKSTELLS